MGNLFHVVGLTDLRTEHQSEIKLCSSNAVHVSSRKFDMLQLSLKMYLIFVSFHRFKFKWTNVVFIDVSVTKIKIEITVMKRNF